MALMDDFESALDSVMAKTTGEGSIYRTTIAELETSYTEAGLTDAKRHQLIADVSAQLAISVTNSAIGAAIELAKSSSLIAAQVATEEANASFIEAKELVTKESRLDNLLIEDMKAQLQKIATAAAGGLTVSTADFASAKELIDRVYKKAQGKDITGSAEDITFEAGSLSVAT